MSTTTTAPIDPLRPSPRGWSGPGGGRSSYVQAADEWRGTTNQVCGLYPFSIGTGSPMVGVPLGKNLLSGSTLCCDPFSWFVRARLISNPSMFMLAKPGLGKSTLTRRMALGLSAYGVLPFVLGDLRPDYVALIDEIGGQVLPLGRGRAHMNILDIADARAAADRLTGSARASLLEDAYGRQLTMTTALLSILRDDKVTSRENTILDRALDILNDRHRPGQPEPLLGDLLKVIQDAPETIREVALDRGSMDKYQAVTENLEADLMGLLKGKLGATFAKPTTTPMRRDKPVVFDISGIAESDVALQAASLLACWSAGFATVNTAAALAEAGLEPRRYYFVILDELWRVLRAGRGMVDRIDALTRLNRAQGVATAMISHTIADLESLANEEDRIKARGFVDRAGMVICGGLPVGEMPDLNTVVPTSRAEQDMLVSWTDPPAWDHERDQEEPPPGRGKFLIKIGGRPGIPIETELTAAEKKINDTNALWNQEAR